jgi:PAS domain S-box-containing protein
MIKFNLKNLKTISILYVEDEDALRKQSVIIYKKLFKNVYEASNGEEALVIIKNETLSFDIIITDINMPKMSGLELARRAKEFSLIPFIITSAYSQNEYFLEAIELGIKKFIIKPTTINTMIADVENAVNSYRKELKLRHITKTLIVETQKNSKILSSLKENKLAYDYTIDFYKDLSNNYISMLRTDSNGIITKVSSKLIDFLGFTKEQLIHRDIATLKDKSCDNVTIQKQMLEAIRSKKTIHSVHTFVRNNKSAINVKVTMSLFLNNEEYVEGYNFYLEAILD